MADEEDKVTPSVSIPPASLEELLERIDVLKEDRDYCFHQMKAAIKEKDDLQHLYDRLFKTSTALAKEVGRLRREIEERPLKEWIRLCDEGSA